MRTIFKIWRGTKSLEQVGVLVPQEGEMFYATDTKELMCGDGTTPIKSLKAIGCIAKSPSGKLFAVEVDDNGNAITTPLFLKTQKPKREFDVYV